MHGFEPTAAAARVGMVVKQAGARGRAVQPFGAAHVPYPPGEVTFHRGLSPRNQGASQTGILHASLYYSMCCSY